MERKYAKWTHTHTHTRTIANGTTMFENRVARTHTLIINRLKWEYFAVFFLEKKERAKNALTGSYSKHNTVLHDRIGRELSHGLLLGMHGQNKYKRASKRGRVNSK